MNEKKIRQFIDTRTRASENTKLAYYYDLRSFVSFVTSPVPEHNEGLTQTQLNLYQASLLKLAKSSQQRKITNINLFLKYLYQSGDMPHFYELQHVAADAFGRENHKSAGTTQSIVNLDIYYQKVLQPGDLIALLILEFGLKPYEIQQLHWRDFDWNFKILTFENSSGLKRILPIRERFARLVRPIKNADELFAKSRQFLHYELKKTSSLTSSDLREFYIRQRVSEKIAITELTELLGLKSSHSLEKYYR
ncbi:tyrosine recombinase XerD-like protein [Lactococcus insecticola]|uniref:Tyrosine recombinase XerD-like protein n=1 Tax=Pseudolactococcus insecticola TaxID=2709158 RepID=A0A6A0B876_9LACT|nr:tyrosine recombinase XerD-like protein [Lactococcus insecticola]